MLSPKAGRSAPGSGISVALKFLPERYAQSAKLLACLLSMREGVFVGYQHSKRERLRNMLGLPEESRGYPQP